MRGDVEESIFLYIYKTTKNTMSYAHIRRNNKNTDTVKLKLSTCLCARANVTSHVLEKKKSKINLENDPSLQIRVGTQVSGSVRMGGWVIGEKRARREVSRRVSAPEFSDR